MAREDFLFSGTSWFDVYRHQRQKMSAEIEDVDPDRGLNTPVEDLAEYFAEKYKIAAPTQTTGEIYQEHWKLPFDLCSKKRDDLGREFFLTVLAFDAPTLR